MWNRALIITYCTLMLLCSMSCSLFAPELNSVPSQLPTAEYLLENPSRGGYVITTLPRVNSPFRAGETTINFVISRTALEALGVNEDDYDEVVNNGLLEIDQQRVYFNCCIAYMTGPIINPIWNSSLGATVFFSPGLHVATFSIEYDGQIFSESWVYQVVNEDDEN